MGQDSKLSCCGSSSESFSRSLKVIKGDVSQKKFQSDKSARREICLKSSGFQTHVSWLIGQLNRRF